MEIIKTTWINVTGVFAAVFVHAVLKGLIDVNGSTNLFQATLAALWLVCLYGLLFWILFGLSLVGLDFVLFARNHKNLGVKLLAEWFIISCPFFYWAMRYREWIFLTGIIALLITQFIRRMKIQLYLEM